MEQGAVRNLEQIQEHDGQGHTPRLMAAALVIMGAACVMFAALALGGRKAAPSAAPTDPLGDLVAKSRAGAAGSPKPTDLSAHDVTFPGILSDDNSPTTALAAVRSGAGAASNAAPPPATPPPPTDR